MSPSFLKTAHSEYTEAFPYCNGQKRAQASLCVDLFVAALLGFVPKAHPQTAAPTQYRTRSTAPNVAPPCSPKLQRDLQRTYWGPLGQYRAACWGCFATPRLQGSDVGGGGPQGQRLKCQSHRIGNFFPGAQCLLKE